MHMNRRILTFSLFEAKTGLTPEQEAFLNRYTKGRWTYDPVTGLVNLSGNFDCSGGGLNTLNDIKFGKVNGSFNCGSNDLTSLEGAPQEVGGWFDCDAFRLEKGQWNIKGWLKVLEEGIPEAQNLIATLLTPKVLNKEIQQDPAGMIMKLKEVWNDESFRETRDQLVWPKGYEDQADLVGDLDDVGF